MGIINGVYTAMVTPFDKNFKVDYKKLAILLKRQIEAKVAGIVLNSTTGESLTLSESEKEKIIKFVLKINKGRLKIIVGVGNSSTQKTLSEIKKYNNYKIDGFLFSLPCYNKPNESGLLLHVENCAKASKHPMIIYYVPSRTGQYLKFDLLEKLCEHKNIVGIKECSGSLVFLAKCTRIKPEFMVFCGNDQLIDGALRLGAVGLISVASNVCPKEILNVYNLFCLGKLKESQQTFLDIEEFCEALFIETNPAPLKFAFNALNLNVGLPRLPLAGVKLESKTIIRQSIINADIKLQL